MLKQKNNKINPSSRHWKELLSELDVTLERNDRRFKWIQEMDRRIQQTADNSDSTFEHLLNEGINELGADYGHIVVKHDSENLFIKFSNCRDDINRIMPISKSLCGNVFITGELIQENDVELLIEDRYFPLHLDTKCELALPILDSRGIKNFGILNIEWTEKHKITEDTLNFCKLLTGQIAIAMEQRKLWQGVQFVSDLSNELLVNLKSPEEVYKFILDRVLNLLDFDLGQILLVNGDKLLIVASSNVREIRNIVEIDSVCGYYIFEKKGKTPLNIPDLETDEEFKDKYKWLLGTDKETKLRMRSEFVAPLIDKYNNVVGVINIEDPRINAFSTFDISIINIFGKMIMSAIDASNEREKIQQMEKIQQSDLELAHQGHLAVGFLHNFGGMIGNARARLSEFKREISLIDNGILPTFSNQSSVDFIEGILQNLRESGDLARNFRKQMESAKNSVVQTKINLLTYLNEAITRAERKATGSLKISLTKDPFMENKMTIDALLTEQFGEALNIIFNNAIEAMPNGGEIEVNLSLSGLSSAIISISDTGTGMTQETADRIFDFGYTTKKHLSSRLGEGLGLWFVKSYLERLNGSISVSSKINVGTTFSLNIPINL